MNHGGGGSLTPSICLIIRLYPTPHIPTPRVLPSAHMVFRRAEEDIEVAGYTLKKGERGQPTQSEVCNALSVRLLAQLSILSPPPLIITPLGKHFLIAFDLLHMLDENLWDEDLGEEVPGHIDPDRLSESFRPERCD